jgi:hypothetical protein
MSIGYRQPSTFTYVVDANGIPLVLGYGDDVTASAGEAIAVPLRTPPDRVPPKLRDCWGAYIVYCGEKARRVLGKSAFRPLRVSIVAEMSNPDANAHIRAQAASRGPQIVGHVSAR